MKITSKSLLPVCVLLKFHFDFLVNSSSSGKPGPRGKPSPVSAKQAIVLLLRLSQFALYGKHFSLESRPLCSKNHVKLITRTFVNKVPSFDNVLLKNSEQCLTRAAFPKLERSSRNFQIIDGRSQPSARCCDMNKPRIHEIRKVGIEDSFL